MSDDDSLGSFSFDDDDHQSVWNTPCVIEVDSAIPFSLTDLPTTEFGSLTSPPSPTSKHSDSQISSVAIPSRRKSRIGFACFGSRRHHADSDNEDDNMSISPVHNMPAQPPAIAKGKSILPQCKLGGNVHLGLLRRHQPELYQDFHKYLISQFCDENLDCWEALHEIMAETDKARMIELCQNALETFFLPHSPSQIGCTEVYTPMMSLCRDIHSVPQDQIIHSIQKITDTLECQSIQDPFTAWLILP